MDGEGWPFANLEIKVTTVLTECLGINGSEVDLALMLFCNWSKGLGEGCAFFFGFGEDVCKRETSLQMSYQY